jgi:phenylpropionate dioxygenase-like ring-hydroxylating dioxygenase large terminal subunit
MLSKQDNEILTQVSAGTPMGDLMREYWIPAFVSSELEADGWPRRIRLLGEDLIAYRDAQGGVGVIDENCPHRGSSMIFARNEDGGVRCVYHGWKFESSGACVDMPSEGPESNFKDKVRIKAYVTRERNGIVWVYMGPRQTAPPPLPEIEINLDGAPRRREGVPFKYVRQCNWAQALEGDIDTVHTPFLHSRLNVDYRASENIRMADKNPYLEIVSTPSGFVYGSRYTGPDYYLWRITHFVMPFYTYLHDNGGGGKVWMPIDDHNTLIMEWSPSRKPSVPRDYDDLTNMTSARQPWGYKPDDMMIPWGNWRLKADVDNEWLRDRSLEKDKLFLGIYSNPLQDSAVQVTMGSIYDRTKEYLGTTDKAIIAFRRTMIQAAKAFRDRAELPATVDDSTLYRVRGTEVVLPKDADWLETTAPWRVAFSEGPPPEYRPGRRSGGARMDGAGPSDGAIRASVPVSE